MEIEYACRTLDQLETDLNSTGGFSKEIVRAFRKRVQAIRAAVDERDLYAVRGNRFEKLTGKRANQYSLRLNDQWRLIVEIRKAKPKNIIIVKSIEDYH
jgi:proteic killer suppression protein